MKGLDSTREKIEGKCSMNENLFIASKQEIKNEVVQVNLNFNFYKYKEIPRKEFGHFFYYNRYEEKLYYAKIASVKEFQRKDELTETISDSVCAVQFKNGFFQIEFKDSIREKSLDILKDVYAKSNVEMIGDRTFSIYHTIKLSNFAYALPVIDKALFMVNDAFRDMLLYDNSMIPNDTEERKSFAKIVNEDGELSLTLTNEKMLKVDYEYLLEGNYKEMYRPYFYEFALNESSQVQLKRKISSQNYSEEQLYEIKIISVGNRKDNHNDDLFEGVLLFSASPIKRIPAYIKILHTNENQIVDRQFYAIEQFLKTQISTVQTKGQIEQAFMNKIQLSKKATVNYEVKIYNVGQGNWIHILVYDGDKLISKVVFDIGIGNGKGGHLDKSLRAIITRNAAKEIKDNYIFVLSHWDLDHIQGVVELQRNQFYTTWIMPDLPDKPKNGAKRLVAFLKIDPNITEIFVDHSLNGQLIFNNPYFKLGKGKGDGPGTHVSYTKENNSGLILAIKTASKKMLFPGDCEYIQFPNSFIMCQNYDALVVSHHGAKIKQSNLASLGFIKSGTKKFAAVCVGKGKNYPKSCHKTSIKALGFKVRETRKYKDVNNPCQFRLT